MNDQSKLLSINQLESSRLEAWGVQGDPSRTSDSGLFSPFDFAGNQPLKWQVSFLLAYFPGE